MAQLVYVGLVVLSPYVFMKNLLLFFEHQDSYDVYFAWSMAGGMFVSTFLAQLLIQYAFYDGQRIGIRVSFCLSLISLLQR